MKEKEPNKSSALVKARTTALQSVPSRLIKRGLEDLSTLSLEETVKRLLDTDPNDAEGYFYRGLAFHQNGDYDRAIADYSRALQIDPNFAKAYIDRGLAYYNRGDYDRAIADFNQAVRINPSHAAGHLGLGVSYGRKGNIVQARVALMLARELGHPDAQTLLDELPEW
ncbi:MAG: tetratricopeptide repeat protein [Candidatus Hatepunaea meridiana]|nr:tetratricopeptide repeat protein [Candidatus Hatepunaea meridiana]